MKTGTALAELGAEIERQAQSKKDYVADTRSLSVAVNDEQAGTWPVLRLGEIGTFGIGRTAHTQLAERLEIPKRYYERLVESAPDLWARNVNHWLKATPEQRLIRTLDGRARAFLSNRYRPLDNVDLVTAVLPRVREAGCSIVSCDLSEDRLYLKATTDRITHEVSVGDVVQAGVVISNSEVGLGSVKVEPLVYRLRCLNGMIVGDYSLRTAHIGRSGNGNGFEGAAEFYRDETRQADDRAFWLKVRDTVDATLDAVRFAQIAKTLTEASRRALEGDPVKAVERVAEVHGFTDGERGDVLRHLIAGGELTAWGLGNAITRTSQDLPDYERATQFERLGWGIVSLPPVEWDRLGLLN